MTERVARSIGVHILDAPYQIDREYTYYSDLADIGIGSFVIVPFGRANKRKLALVTSIGAESDLGKLKPVDSLISERIALDGEMMGLCNFLSDRCFCSVGDAVRRFIPSSAFENVEEMLLYKSTPEARLSDRQSEVLSFIKLKSPVKAEKLKKEFGDDVTLVISKLLQLDAIERATTLRPSRDASYKIAFPAENADERELSKPRTPASYKEIYSAVVESDGIPVKDLESAGFKREHIKALERRGLIRIEEREILRNHYEGFEGGGELPRLNEEQTAVFNGLSALMLDEKPHGALLYGVTGSGKTSVILSLCKKAVDSGKTAIVLVPEIGLTWQSVSVFASIFGKRLAIIHSALSDGERYDTFKRIKRGEVDIVLGTRSAIFAPLKNIGLIVIDEEQEHTYKSDTTPKYHAKDVARYRSAHSGALMLLASATPSIESFYKAKTGVYSLFEMKSRYGAAVLPDVILSDMRESENPVEAGYIGEKLREHLEENREAKHQSMLLLNRRGYNSYIVCRMCGSTVSCPKCSVSLTYHKTKSAGTLICHYCGHRQPPPHMCPSCSSSHIQYGGFGTQLIEDEISEKLPGVSVSRMDADSTKGRFSQDDIVESFARGDSEILIGTQMIAKGHNFPNVTLVGVLNADASLFLDDFRANERTFALITQVVGRAGRSVHRGRAVIQTMNPYNETIRLAAAQDYDAFYEDEIAIRRALVFPPFCDITTVTFSSEEESSMVNLARAFREELEGIPRETVPMQLFGPFETPVYKVKNKFRQRIVIKHKNNKSFRDAIARLIIKYTTNARGMISISVDINPSVT